MARPGYPCYRNILTRWAARSSSCRADRRPATSRLSDAGGAAERGTPVKGLIVASPANPTGTVLDPAELAAPRRLLRADRRPADQRRDLPRHLLRGRARDGVRVDDLREAVVVNSFSKYFSMTGWRLGWLLVPPSGCAARSTG